MKNSMVINMGQQKVVINKGVFKLMPVQTQENIKISS